MGTRAILLVILGRYTLLLLLIVNYTCDQLYIFWFLLSYVVWRKSNLIFLGFQYFLITLYISCDSEGNSHCPRIIQHWFSETWRTCEPTHHIRLTLINIGITLIWTTHCYIKLIGKLVVSGTLFWTISPYTIFLEITQKWFPYLCFCLNPLD